MNKIAAFLKKNGIKKSFLALKMGLSYQTWENQMLNEREWTLKRTIQFLENLRDDIDKLIKEHKE